MKKLIKLALSKSFMFTLYSFKFNTLTVNRLGHVTTIAVYGKIHLCLGLQCMGIILQMPGSAKWTSFNILKDVFKELEKLQERNINCSLANLKRLSRS